MKQLMKIYVLVATVMSFSASAACLQSPNVYQQCRFPAGDNWCKRHATQPYAYDSACVKAAERKKKTTKKQATTPAPQPVSKPAPAPVRQPIAKAKPSAEMLTERKNAFARKLQQEIGVVWEDYFRALEEANWLQVVDLRQLKSEEGLANITQIIALSKEAIAKHQTAVVGLPQSWLVYLRNLAEDDVIKEQLYTFLQTWVAQEKMTIAELLTLETEIIDNIESALQVLIDNQDGWQMVKESQASFSDKALAESYSQRFSQFQDKMTQYRNKYANMQRSMAEYVQQQ